MKHFCKVLFLASLLASLASGCGTMLNMDGKERLDFGGSDAAPRSDGKPYVPRFQRHTFPFGGVANDMAWIKSADGPIEVTFSLVDMPFSLVGDVATLPWAVSESLNVFRPNATERHDSSFRERDSANR